MTEKQLLVRERESHEEGVEELVKGGWKCGKNGRGTVDEGSG